MPLTPADSREHVSRTDTKNHQGPNKESHAMGSIGAKGGSLVDHRENHAGDENASVLVISDENPVLADRTTVQTLP